MPPGGTSISRQRTGRGHRVPSSSATAAGRFVSQACRRPPASAAGQRHDGQQGDAAAVERRRPAARRERCAAAGRPARRAARTRRSRAAGVREHVGVAGRCDPGAGGGVKAVTCGRRRGEVEVEEAGVERRLGAAVLAEHLAPAAAARWRASTQTSTVATEDAGRDAGMIRSPRASRPATRRAPIRDSSAGLGLGQQPAAERARQQVRRRGQGDRAVVAVRVARSGLVIPRPAAGGVACARRSRPRTVTTSTRLSAGPRHHTRMVVRSLNRSATAPSEAAKAGRPVNSGSSSPPEDSAYPECATAAEPSARSRSAAAEAPASAAGSALEQRGQRPEHAEQQGDESPAPRGSAPSTAHDPPYVGRTWTVQTAMPGPHAGRHAGSPDTPSATCGSGPALVTQRPVWCTAREVTRRSRRRDGHLRPAATDPPARSLGSGPAAAG